MRHTWVAVISLLVAAGAAAKDAPKLVQVDCGKGESINAALSNPAAALLIEFSGVCAEDVDIGRSNVTLQGNAPGATIAGAPAPAVPAPAAFIRGVANIALKNFAVQDGNRRGVDVRNAGAVTLDGIVATGNFSDGMQVMEAPPLPDVALPGKRAAAAPEPPEILHLAREA